MSDTLIPAAQYLRMSTELQQYSLDNQADAIARYAASHNFVVVKNYADAAKSGLRLKNRKGLQQLIQDVVTGGAPFKAILVYDISRWGRFQDVDEAAHYEYLCKSAGIPVHYCAETFANDDKSLPVAIMKALRRTMAGEYSRDLSLKVRTGQIRLAKLGYKLGGYAPYGLRRLLVDSDGKHKQMLSIGERKALVTDRVILVPGPPEEVSIVRRIFYEFVHKQNTMSSIARRLNREHIPYLLGHRWNVNSVGRVLRHPHYTGTQVWGRTTQFLGTRTRRLPIEQWAICPKAFEGIVDQRLFAAAQARIAEFPNNLSDEQLLDRLRLVLQQNGKLNTTIINTSPLCPSLSTYYCRFGGLMQVYGRLGYDIPMRGQIVSSRQRILIIRRNLLNQVLHTFPGALKELRKPRSIRARVRICKTRQLLTVAVGRSHPTTTGLLHWYVELPKNERRCVCLVAFLDKENAVIDHLMVFRNLVGFRRGVSFGASSEILRFGQRVNDLTELLDAVRSLCSRNQ